MKKLYKVLKKRDSKLVSPYQGMEYEVGKEYRCEDFNEDRDVDCAEGLYATDIDGLPYAYRPDKVLYECKCWGKEVEYDEFKRRYEYMKLTREVPQEEIKEMAKAWEPKVGYKLNEALFPVNPFDIEPPEITDEIIRLVRDCASVWDSVMASVGDSVWASVWDSVMASIRDSVWDSVGASVRVSVMASVMASIRDSVMDSVGASVMDSVMASVWDSVRVSVMDSVMASVWAYMSSLFPNVKKWKHTEHAEGVNPFQPAIDLWHMGLVPTFDGKVWRLHSKNGIEWEGQK